MQKENSFFTLTDTQILNTSYNEPLFIVQDLIPIGLTLLVGGPKSGKTLAATDMAASIASGESFLGCFETMPCDVLFFALEDNSRRIQKRLQLIMGDIAGTGRVHYATKCKRIDQGFFDDLGEWLSKKPAVRLVIIDTFQMVRGHARRGATLYEQDYGSMSTLKKFADERKIAIMVLHHLRKSESRDVIQMVAGSVGITAAADSILVLQKERSSNSAIFSVTGRDIPDYELPLNLNHENLTWELVVPTKKITEDRAKILTVLQEAHKPMKLCEIAESVKKKVNNVHKMIAALVTSGKVSKAGYGFYEAIKTSDQIDDRQNSSESESSNII